MLPRLVAEPATQRAGAVGAGRVYSPNRAAAPSVEVEAIPVAQEESETWW